MTDKEAISNLNQIYGFVSSEIQQSLDLAIKALEEKPQGEWIDCKDFPYLANCSNCGYQMDTHEERGYFRFCPYCGADMRV